MTDRRFGVGFHCPLRTRPGTGLIASIPHFHFERVNDQAITGMGVIRQLLTEKGADREILEFHEFWVELSRFIELRHASGFTEEQILGPARATLRYDFPRWLADGSPKDPTPYRLPEAQEFEFRLTQEGEEGLRSALRVRQKEVQR